MKHNHLLSLLALSLLVLGACGAESAPTQIIVEVDSDLNIPAELERVTVSVEGAEATSASADLTRTPLPRTLGLIHTGGPLGPVGLPDVLLSLLLQALASSVARKSTGTPRIRIFGL